MDVDGDSHPRCSKAHWARQLVREKIAAELNLVVRNHDGSRHSPLSEIGPGPWTSSELPPDLLYTNRPDHEGSHALPKKVCIIGAGVAGLYIAMILDSLGISYDILEADSRVGGRAYTQSLGEKPGPHDYYDVGAMRYPQIPIMKRTFDLFKSLNIPLIPYYLIGENTPKLFNDRFFDPHVKDPHHVSIRNGGSVSDLVADKWEDALDKSFGPFKKELASNFEEGFKKLMKVDNFSTREYLRAQKDPETKAPLYSFFDIQWMETQNTSTGLFDQAFSESVMDSFDFDYPKDPPGSKVQWYCIEGGARILTKAMEDKLKSKVQTAKRVVAISIDDDKNMSVKCANNPKSSENYSAVFSTTTLGCLGRMDLRTLNLHPSQKDAIRALHYDDSVKVALRFKSPWWINKCKISITKGGVAVTDLPLRTCVYPSYNINDDKTKPAILLASYTWAQDAIRMGSMVGKKEDELIDLVLENLVRLHAPHISYKEIKEALTDYHVYSWSHDPRTAGAFALFGPGQFSNLYPYLTRPAADGKFHIVGEAASADHAWIVGALNSAYAAVYKFLRRYELLDAMKEMEKIWGKLDELDAGENGTVHLQVILAKLAKKDQYKV